MKKGKKAPQAFTPFKMPPVELGERFKIALPKEQPKLAKANATLNPELMMMVHYLGSKERRKLAKQLGQWTRELKRSIAVMKSL